MKYLIGLLSVATALGGCTMVDVAIIKTGPPREAKARGQIFVTAGTINEPHESLGLIQVEETGVWLFGNIPIPAQDLDSGFALLRKVARQRGADGVINVRFHTKMYNPGTRVIFAILFFMPLPGGVSVTGELVRLLPERAPMPPATPAPAAPAAPSELSPTPASP